MAAAAVAVLAVLLIVHYAGGGDSDGNAAGHGSRDAADHTPALADPGRAQARLVVSGGTDRLTVTSADLGDGLVQAETPAAQRAVPVLSQKDSGSVTVSTRTGDDNGGGGVDLTVRLSRDVRWDIAIDGGSSMLALDLGQARVQSLDLSQGVATVEADLPHPEGVLRTRIGGGAGAVRLVVPAGVPAQATFSAGGGGATLDGVHHGGLSAGAVLTAPERSLNPGVWSSPDRIDVALDSGVGSLDLTHEG